MSTLHEVTTVLKQWESGGTRLLDNGTVLICQTPHVGPQAWLHSIYAGLSHEKVSALSEQAGRQLPADYAEFLGMTNGLKMFSDSLSFWGYRESWERSGDAAYQPYDLATENRDRPHGVPDSWLFVGSYSWDGSLVFYDFGDKLNPTRLYMCDTSGNRYSVEWPDIWTWLLSEVRRLSNFYTPEGVKIDRSRSTSPIP